MLGNNCMQVDYDEEIGEYFGVWKPVFISTGKTKSEALKDLRQVAHFGVDALINLELKNTNKIKEV